MSNVKQLTDKQGANIYPITDSAAVIIGNTTVNNEIDNINSILESVQERLDAGISGGGSTTVASGENILGSASNSVSNASTSTTNESTYLNHVVNGSVTSSLKLVGGNGSTVSAQNGVLTVNAVDTKNTVGTAMDENLGFFRVPLVRLNENNNNNNGYATSSCTNMLYFQIVDGNSDGVNEAYLTVNGHITCDSIQVYDGITATKFKTTTAIGSTSTPIYINAQGTPTACTSVIATSATNATNADKIKTTHNNISLSSNGSTLTGLYLTGASSTTAGYNTLQTLPVQIGYTKSDSYTGNILLCATSHALNADASTTTEKVDITNDTANATNYLTFSSGYSTGSRNLKSDSHLNYNPSTNQLNIGTATDGVVYTRTFNSSLAAGNTSYGNLHTKGSYTKAAPIFTVRTSDGRIYGFFPYNETNMSVGTVNDCRIVRLA